MTDTSKLFGTVQSGAALVTGLAVTGIAVNQVRNIAGQQPKKRVMKKSAKQSKKQFDRDYNRLIRSYF